MPALSTPTTLLLSLQLAAVPPVPAATDTPAPEAYPGASELAAEAPVPPWQHEGGAAAHASKGDPHENNRKMRRAGATAIAGGAILVLGLSATIAGFVMYGMPRNRLEELKKDNGGVLPTDDPKRQRAITMSRVSPALMGAGLGLVVVGAVMAGVAGSRFKKMREEKRTSVAFSPMFMRQGGGVALGVRF